MDDLTVSIPPSLPPSLVGPSRPIAFENSTHSEGDHQEMASGGRQRDRLTASAHQPKRRWGFCSVGHIIKVASHNLSYDAIT